MKPTTSSSPTCRRFSSCTPTSARLNSCTKSGSSGSHHWQEATPGACLTSRWAPWQLEDSASEKDMGMVRQPRSWKPNNKPPGKFRCSLPTASGTGGGGAGGGAVGGPPLSPLFCNGLVSGWRAGGGGGGGAVCRGHGGGGHKRGRGGEDSSEPSPLRRRPRPFSMLSPLVAATFTFTVCTSGWSQSKRSSCT